MPEMSEANEIVVIEISTDRKISLYGQISSAMERLGYNPCDYESLELGFDLLPDWPCGKNCELLLSQLVVIARKLKLRIVIDGLSAEPMFREGIQDGPGIPE
jgi:hypothetical protein